MSALAMFSLKSPSLLAFDTEKVEEPVRHNLETLYGITRVPSDTYMREDLDEVNPQELREAFLAIFRQIQSGKLLDRYRFLNDTYLISVDGSQVFSSNQVHCDNCCEKVHRRPDGNTITYHHQILAGVIVHPECRQVIPLCPEPITRQDGSAKNDCERNALRRFLDDFKREHPRLKATIISDALSANAPHVNHLRSLGLDFIVNVKPNPSLPLTA